MVLTLLAVGLISLVPLAAAPKPVPQLPFNEVFARDGKIVVEGKEFRATAHRLSILPE